MTTIQLRPRQTGTAGWAIQQISEVVVDGREIGAVIGQTHAGAFRAAIGGSRIGNEFATAFEATAAVLDGSK